MNIFKSIIKPDIVKIFCLSCIVCFTNIKYAQAIKIVATIDTVVITDYDIEEFIPILCFFENKTNKQCIKEQEMPLALMTLVETTLKEVHIKRLQIPDNAIDKKNFDNYINDFLKKIKDKKNINQEKLIWYLKNEYIWHMIINSQLQEIKITDEEKEDYALENNIQITKNNDQQITSILLQKRANEISQSLMEKMKKFYIVDIKL